MLTVEKSNWPKSVDEAVYILINNLSVEEKQTVFETGEDELYKLEKEFGNQIRNGFGIWSNNNVLIESCRTYTDYAGFDNSMHPDFITATIIKELWKKLKTN